MKKTIKTIDKGDQILNEVRGLKGEMGVFKEEIVKEVRRLGVVVEHVDGKVDLLAEQYGDIKKTLDQHTETLETHTEMIGDLAVNMQIVKSDIELIKSGLRKKVDVEDFEILEKRVAALEKRR